MVFISCSALRKVNLPDSMYRIGMAAFDNCSCLQTIKLPADLWFIDRFAFENCTQLKKIVIPEEVREIGDNVFAGCTSLSDVTMQSTELDWVGKDILLDTPFFTDRFVHFPDSAFKIGENILRSGVRASSYAYICCEIATSDVYLYAVDHDIRFYSCSGAHNGIAQS